MPPPTTAAARGTGRGRLYSSPVRVGLAALACMRHRGRLITIHGPRWETGGPSAARTLGPSRKGGYACIQFPRTDHRLHVLNSPYPIKDIRHRHRTRQQTTKQLFLAPSIGAECSIGRFGRRRSRTPSARSDAWEPMLPILGAVYNFVLPIGPPFQHLCMLLHS